MSLVPAFEIGLWNAWILAIVLLLYAFIPGFMLKDFTKKMGDTSALNKTENIINILGSFLFFGLIIFSIFLPLQLGTAWFYVGLALCVSGVVVWTIAIVNIAAIPLGKQWTKGLYHYSRHPMYFATFLILIGVGIASASWVFLLCSIVYIILVAILVIAEERFCLEKFGDAYRDYMDRAPRWLGIPRTVKSK